jgi:hypothetical protein
LLLRLRLRKTDFVRYRVDREQQVALTHDVAILEMNAGQRAAHLSAQFDLIHRRELAEKTEPCIEFAHQRPAHRHLMQRRRFPLSRAVAAAAGPVIEPCSAARDCNRGHNGHCPDASCRAAGLAAAFEHIVRSCFCIHLPSPRRLKTSRARRPSDI